MHRVPTRYTLGPFPVSELKCGLLAVVSCLCLFATLADSLNQDSILVRFDLTVAATLHRWATPRATTILLLATELGGSGVIALGLVVGVLCCVRRKWLFGAMWLAGLSGGEALNLLLKYLYSRPRPTLDNPFLIELNDGFPSGHAMAALIAYGMLAYFAMLTLRSRPARVLVLCVTTLVVLLVGFSRIYLRLHTFSDVAGGFAAGGWWLSTCIMGMKLLRRRR